MSYVGLSVQIHGTNQHPETVREMIEEMIRSIWDHEYHSDIMVDVEEFSGNLEDKQ